MKNSLKVLGFLLAFLVPAGCLAVVQKNWLMVLIGCCFGDSRPETGGPSTVYEQRVENPSESTEQEECFVDISHLFTEKAERSNNLVKSYLESKKK